MTKDSHIELYQFRNFDYDAFYETYIHKITPHAEAVNVNMFTGEVETITTKRRPGAKSKTTTINKCRYLQDTFIRLSHLNEDGTIALSASTLEKVIGKDYLALLETFCDLGYITKGTYEIGKHPTYFWLNIFDYEKSKPEYNATIQKYLERTDDCIKKASEQYLEKKAGANFLKLYLNSLNYIKISDKDGYNNVVSQIIQEKPNSKDYYQYLLSELEKKHKRIYNIDDNGRIYHILTNLKKELRQYLTIDFALDCSNSQPLLLNYFIWTFKHISLNTGYTISSFLKTYIINNINVTYREYHYVSQNLRKLLIDNNIEIESVAKLTDDELRYIFLTTNGLLWDYLHQKHTDINKDAYKETMFKSVFFATTAHLNDIDTYSSEFSKEFNTVFKMIEWWRDPASKDDVKTFMDKHGLYPERYETSFSKVLTVLEAKIFREILTRIYAKRWCAVNLHDCIVVPLDNKKNHPSVQQIQEIMADVYKRYGLAPTFKIDKF